MKKLYKKYTILALIALLLVAVPFLPAQAAGGEKTYIVTANLFVPGKLNTQLPGVTAYLTNGNNPLGVDGYEAVAPTTPVSQNASLVVDSNGGITLKVPVLNPVFTLQKIGGCSNASVLKAEKDSRQYTASDASASCTGRITSLTLELKDRSGSYVFNDCSEFPTLLGTMWTVPLTLSVDFSGVDFSSSGSSDNAANQIPASSNVNYDKLKAVISTVDTALKTAVISKDGTDVDAGSVWITQSAADTLTAELAKARAGLSGEDQATVDKAAAALTSAYETFCGSEKSGTKADGSEEGLPGTMLAKGTYTVSCNIWFNKADTGLPLNPHITNDTFPPYNSVVGNATLVVDGNGCGKVTIPVVIQDKVMTVRSLTGLNFTDIKKNDAGAITSVSVDLGNVPTDSTVITKSCTAEIEMGDLAMSISGLEKKHTWPATFELNLSGVSTVDGRTMPKVEVEMTNEDDASKVMASVNSEEDLSSQEEEQDMETGSDTYIVISAVALGAVLVIAAAVFFIRKRRRRG